jgi:hypothetical protein
LFLIAIIFDAFSRGARRIVAIVESDVALQTGDLLCRWLNDDKL